jgi:hypothetical protein
MTSTLPVRSLREFLAAVPYVLGFHPADSVVVVALRGARIAFAARHDLPDLGTDAEQARAHAARTAELVVRQGAERAIVIGYGDPARVTPAVLRATEALRRRHFPVIDELRVTGGRFWSYGCKDLDCCPVDGTPCGPGDTAVAARATYQGKVALPDRDAFVAQLAPVAGDERSAMAAATDRAVERLAGLHTGDDITRAVLRAGRTAVRDAERRYRSGSRLTNDDAAWLGVLLRDIRVRDHAWERCGAEDWRLRLWTDVLRRVQPPYVPAPGGLLAFTAWRQGQGALAAAAVDRALRADPDYPMAQLIGQALDEGLPPALLDEPRRAGPAPRAGRRRDRRGTRRRVHGRAVS